MADGVTAEMVADGARAVDALAWGQQHGGADPSSEEIAAAVLNAALSPSRDGVTGRYLSRWDSLLDERPLRPYLPLTESDDDEFFDAPEGTVLTIATGAGEDEYVRAGGAFSWNRVGTGEAFSAGELWVRVVGDFDHPRTTDARLTLPHGVLYSDRTYFVDANDVDVPIDSGELSQRLDRRRGEMVSDVVVGDAGVVTVVEPWEEPVVFDASSPGYLHYASADTDDRRSAGVRVAAAFDRAGDVVIRLPQGDGYREQVFRLAPGVDDEMGQ